MTIIFLYVYVVLPIAGRLLSNGRLHNSLLIQLRVGGIYLLIQLLI